MNLLFNISNTILTLVTPLRDQLFEVTSRNSFLPSAERMNILPTSWPDSETVLMGWGGVPQMCLIIMTVSGTGKGLNITYGLGGITGASWLPVSLLSPNSC